jgi:FkbM family methyltransferase
MTLLSSSYEVLRYICNNNKASRIPYVVLRSVTWQLMKRITGSITTVKLINGKNIFIFPDNEVSSFFIYSDLPDRNEVMLLREGTSCNTIFLDIGANIGSYSLLMSDVAKVIAFEPHPSTAARLKMNFLLNGMDITSVYEYAIGKEDGSVLFTDTDSSATNRIMGPTDKNASIRVNQKKLDTIVEDLELRKDSRYVIKIDVEGGECDVFLGASNFLRDYDVRLVVFECFDQIKLNIITQELSSIGFYIEKVSSCNYIATKDVGEYIQHSCSRSMNSDNCA